MLGLRPRKKAEFSPIQSGSVIHFVLEQMGSRHGARGLHQLTHAALREECQQLLAQYLQTVFGEGEIPKRMRYLFSRLTDTLTRLLSQLAGSLPKASLNRWILNCLSGNTEKQAGGACL